MGVFYTKPYTNTASVKSPIEQRKRNCAMHNSSFLFGFAKKLEIWSKKQRFISEAVYQYCELIIAVKIKRNGDCRSFLFVFAQSS